MNLLGLSKIHVELSNICNKNCYICGRRKRDNELIKKNINIDKYYGNMKFELIKKISENIPLNSGLIIATHNNGESMESPHYGEAIKLFKERGCFVYTVSNGQKLLEKKDEIIDNLDSLSISVFENDSQQDKQFQILKEFLKIKGNKSPHVTIRLIGNVNYDKYKKLNCLIIKRLLHKPEGSFGYKTGINGVNKEPTIPEHGVCFDFLTTLAINIYGDVFCCVRYNPDNELLIGNIKNNSLEEIWNCEKRTNMKKKHITGKRNDISFCSKKCQYYGIPTGG